MTGIRIALTGLPRILEEIVINIVSTQQDMEIAASFEDYEALLSSTGNAEWQVIVLGLPNSDVENVCKRVSATFPRAKVVGIEDQGRQAFLYELKLHGKPLGESSPTKLIEAIRDAARSAETEF